MAEEHGGTGGASVLRNKRDATQYRILVQVAERQPAVSQQEIADAIGITSQAVSDYLRTLVETNYVEKHGRGRYEVTKEGVDWLISQTDALRGYVDHVSEAVIEEVDIEAALATASVAEGQTVTLAMHDGVLRATPGETGGATAVAVTDAEAGEDVGVTNFEGLVDYELGGVTVVTVPPVREGGSAAVSPAIVTDRLADHDRLAVAGTEGLALAERVGADPDVRFGTAEAVQEAAMKGLDVLLLAVGTGLSSLTSELSEANVGYEVVDESG